MKQHDIEGAKMRYRSTV